MHVHDQDPAVWHPAFRHEGEARPTGAALAIALLVHVAVLMIHFPELRQSAPARSEHRSSSSSSCRRTRFGRGEVFLAVVAAATRRVLPSRPGDDRRVDDGVA